MSALWRLYPHRLLGHHWVRRDEHQCEGCLRWVRMWECPACTATRETRMTRTPRRNPDDR